MRLVGDILWGPSPGLFLGLDGYKTTPGRASEGYGSSEEGDREWAFERPRSSQRSSGQYGTTTSLGGLELVPGSMRFMSPLRMMRGWEMISAGGASGTGAGVGG